MQQHERIENLHQQAAANYLQGDLSQALKFWQELLQIDPADERALEGVRLCEFLSEEGDLAPAPAGHPESGPSTEGDARVAPAEDESDLDLSALDFQNAPSGSCTDGDDAGAHAGLDLGDLPSIGHDVPSGHRDGARELGSIASAELQIRINELMLQATRAFDAGDPDSALETLDRVFILDDGSPAALALQRQILAETRADHDYNGDPGPVAAPNPEFDTDLPAVAWPGEDHGPIDEPTPESPAPPLTATFQSTPELPPLTLGAPRAPRARWALRLPRLSRPMMLAVAGAIVVGVGGWYGYSQFFGPQDESPAEPAVVAPPPDAPSASAEAPKAKPDKKGNKKNKKGKKGAEAEVPPAPVYTAEQIPQLLADAQADAAAGEYAAAIVGFNAILGVDPEHAEARDGLESAAEKYRAQREFDSKIATATTAWQGGDYSTAMRIFYRLPEAQGDPVYAGYIRDGWYNLAIQALRNQDCESARSHVEEYRVLAPQAPELSQLDALAGRCGYSARDPAYRPAVDALPIRPLGE